MPKPRTGSRLLAAGAALTLVVTALVTGLPTAAARPVPVPPPATAAPSRYIVTLADSPIASYTGGTAGLAATRPSHGRKVSATSTAARRYRSYLLRRQDEAAARVGATPDTHYAVTLNGFTASLTPDQARTLRSASGVLAVTKDRLVKAAAASNNVDFLHLSGSTGVWSALGGTAKAGAGVVVGMIDSGIWPQSKSFAGPALGTDGPTAADPYRPYRSGSTVRMAKADGSDFVGTCQTGQSFTAADCNTKLISARYFDQGWRASLPPGDVQDYRSPRDGDGHGTHTASTAAGDAGVKASIAGHSLGTVSGVAPAAKIAVYKVLWTSSNPADSGGATSDILAAVDQAVTDGVDVLNYSVGTSLESPLDDPVQLAFLNAAEAGIFVAAAAGNGGPGAGTLDNTSPWVTTVAASSLGPRTGTVRLGNGKKYLGITSTVSRSVAGALVRGSAVRAGGVFSDDAAVCAPDTLSKKKVKGKIVVCESGSVLALDKSAEVKRAGGKAMVLVNLASDSLDAQSHSVPTVVVNPPATAAIRSYAAKAKAKVTLTPGNSTGSTIHYPQIAPFSSRGPSANNTGDLLKPDLAAPGVDQLAAYAPLAANAKQSFAFDSGTSMAAPQVSGLAALYLSRYPTMKPMAIKSALMTTATRTVSASGKAVDNAYAQGAGEVTPARMFAPGVVFAADRQDWLGYLEGQGVDTESGVAPIDPSDYNAASIAIGNFVQHQTVTRTLTAVTPGVYSLTARVPGVTTTVAPATVAFTAAGQTRTVQVTFDRTTAKLGQVTFGALSVTGAGTTARVPVALTPGALDAPAELAVRGTSGSTTFSVRPGVSGAFPVTAHGAATAVTRRGTVSARTGEPASFSVRVPKGIGLARFRVAADSPEADVDLLVLDDGDDPVAESVTNSGTEQADVDDLGAGDYSEVVEPYADPPGQTRTAFTVGYTLVPRTAAGNLTVETSGPATAGRLLTVTVRWSGLPAGTTSLGYLQYPDGHRTVVSITS